MFESGSEVIQSLLMQEMVLEIECPHPSGTEEVNCGAFRQQLYFQIKLANIGISATHGTLRDVLENLENVQRLERGIDR